MPSRAQQQVTPNADGIQSNPPRQLVNLPERHPALPLRHPAARLGHAKCHEYVDIARNRVMQAMSYSGTAVTPEDHDIDRPPGLERLPLHLQESLLNSDLTDDTVAIHRNPDGYLVALPSPEGVIDELPRPARRRLVLRTRPIRIFNESRDRRPVGARRLSHDDSYRDLLQRANVRLSAEAWIIHP